MVARCSWEVLEDGNPERTIGGVQSLGLVSPDSGALVPSEFEVVGWAVNFSPEIAALYFSIDGRLLRPNDYRWGFCAPQACIPPFGNGHSECRPMSGFRATLSLDSVGAFAPGSHTLQIVALTPRGLPTVLEIPIRIGAVPPNPSLQPTSPGRSPGFGR